MTTTQQTKQPAPLVPEVLTEEHHEALQASWELPAHDRQAAPQPTSRKPLYVGLIAGALGLTIGFGAGYVVHSQTVETVAPITISRAAGPVDANGMTLGRRVAPFDTMTPTAPAAPAAVDANGMILGPRVPPIE